MDNRYFCNSCEYKWESRKSFGEPSICPRCKKENITKYSNTKEYKEEQKQKNEIKRKFLEDLNKLMKKEKEKINNNWLWSKKKKEEEIKKMKENSWAYFFRPGPVHEEARKLENKYGWWYDN